LRTLLRIDSHHHLWDPKWRPYSWMDSAQLAPIARPFSISDFESEIADTEITASILVQVLPTYDETPDFLRIAANSQTIFGVVGWIDLIEPDSWRRINHYRDCQGSEKLVGIRELIQDKQDPGWMLQDQVIENVRGIGREGLVFDLLTQAHQLSDTIELVKRCPDVRFVLDHLSKPGIKIGNLRIWKEDIRKLSGFENVACKVSGLITEAKWHEWKLSDFEPYFEVALECFGRDRLMYGSDWPVCNLSGNYRQVYELAEGLTSNLSQTELELFWGKNAARIYGLRLTRP